MSFNTSIGTEYRTEPDQCGSAPTVRYGRYRRPDQGQTKHCFPLMPGHVRNHAELPGIQTVKYGVSRYVPMYGTTNAQRSMMSNHGGSSRPHSAGWRGAARFPRCCSHDRHDTSCRAKPCCKRQSSRRTESSNFVRGWLVSRRQGQLGIALPPFLLLGVALRAARVPVDGERVCVCLGGWCSLMRPRRYSTVPGASSESRTGRIVANLFRFLAAFTRDRGSLIWVSSIERIALSGFHLRATVALCDALLSHQRAHVR